MPTEDGFDPDHTLPLFLSDEPEQQDIGPAWDRAVIASRLVTATVLVATATAIGTAILWVGNPVKLFAEVASSLVNTSALQPSNDQTMLTLQPTAAVLPPIAKQVEKSALQPGADQSMPTLQSTADAQPLPPSAKDAQTRDEIAASSQSADQSQTENSAPSSESLFRLFQAWADEKDAQAQAEPMKPVQDGRAQVAVLRPAPLRPKQKHAHVRPIDSARAEMRNVPNPRKKAAQEQNARVQVPPAQDTGARRESEQNAQLPSLLQTYGWSN